MLVTASTACTREGIEPAGDVELHDVYAALSHLSAVYPGFERWYHYSVVPGIRIGTRCILVARKQAQILGVAILKKTDLEQKLCTLWVDPNCRKLKVATTLAARAFDWLGTRYPLLTVPEERMGEFAPLLNYWRFHERERLVGYYRPGKVEYAFNSYLRPKVNG
jgi:hypothetical protein